MIMFFLVSFSASAKDGVQDSTNCGSVHLLFRLSSQVFFCKLLFHTTLFVSCPSILFFLQHLQIVIYINLFQIVVPNSFTIFEGKCQEFPPHPTIFFCKFSFCKSFFCKLTFQINYFSNSCSGSFDHLNIYSNSVCHFHKC